MSEEGILKKIQSWARKFKQKVKTILLKCDECNLFGSDKFDDKFDDEFDIFVLQAYHGPNGRNGTVNFNAMNANNNGRGKKDGSGDDSTGGDDTNSKSKEEDKKEGGKDKNGEKKGSGFLGLRKKGLFGFGAKSGNSQARRI